VIARNDDILGGPTGRSLGANRRKADASVLAGGSQLVASSAFSSDMANSVWCQVNHHHLQDIAHGRANETRHQLHRRHTLGEHGLGENPRLAVGW